MSYLTNLIKELAEESTKPEALPGTYAAFWLSKTSANQLYEFYKPFIKDLEKPEDFHITTTYSRVPVPALKNKTAKIKLDHNFFQLDLLGQGHMKEYLVLKVDHPALQAAWKLAMKNGATWDFPTFIPHISLCTKFKGNSVVNIPVPDFDLECDNYKVDELKD